MSRTMLFLATLFIGGLLTLPAAYMAGFTDEALSNWAFNSLFAAAVLGFIGSKFIFNDKMKK